SSAGLRGLPGRSLFAASPRSPGRRFVSGREDSGPSHGGSAMNRGLLALRYSCLSLLEMLRHPTYVLTTLLFPSMFFWFFGVPNAKEPGAAQLLMGSFSGFAVLGVVLFQLTVGTAQDRASGWNSYLRTLPVPA